MPLFHSKPSPVVAAPEPASSGRHSLFKRNEPVVVAPEPTTRRHSLFKRNEPTPTTVTPSPVSKRTHGSFSSRASGQSASSMSTTGSHRRSGVLSRFGRDSHVDPTIAIARERVDEARGAESQADKALDEARHRVREARDLAARAEAEAAEDARRAKVKQHQARDVTKKGKVLGREYYPIRMRTILTT